MRRATAFGVAVLLLLLVGCTGLPTSGQVNPGRDPLAVDNEPGVAFAPDGPQAGASPQQIVEGFLRAGTGTQDEWATAKEFLTPQFAEEWEPRASVTIDRFTDRTVLGVSETEDAAAVSAVVEPTGQLDAAGSYAPVSGTTTDLPFELQRVGGEWRIARAQDGIVLFEELFRSVFRSASVMYFDPAWEYLVPDVRWFPRTNTAGYVTAALAGTPSAWLTGAVVSAFPDGVVPASRTVTASEGVADVEIGQEALSLGSETLGRMQAQLDETFGSIGFSSVRMTVDGSPLQVSAAPVRSTRVDTRTLAQLEDGTFGYISDDAIEPISDLSAAVESLGLNAAIETGPDLDIAAVLTSSGTVVRALEDGSTATLDARTGLLPPTVDPTGAIWTVPAQEPTEVAVHRVDSGAPITVAGAWPEVTGIQSMQLSRDGARIAGLVTVRGQTELWVAGVRRSADEQTVELGEPYLLAVTTGAGLDLAWLDDRTVAVLEDVAGEVRLREQLVGGPGTDLTTPAGVDRVVGGNSSPRLISQDGTVYVRQATNWLQLTAGVRVLAAQQGAP
jgi:hypothetical protein